MKNLDGPRSHDDARGQRSVMSGRRLRFFADTTSPAAVGEEGLEGSMMRSPS